MDRGAERDDEVGDLIAAAVLLGAFEGNRNGRGRGLGPDGGDVGRDHVLDHLEGILLRDGTRYHILEHDDHQVQDDDDREDLGEDAHDLSHRAGIGHVGEDAVDVEGQQRDQHARDKALDDLLELMEDAFQRTGLGHGDADAHDERGDERGHDAHERGHLHREEAGEHGVLRVLGIVHDDRAKLQEGREHGAVNEVGKGARDQRGQIGNAGGDGEGLARAGAQVGNAGGNEADDDQRNAEAEEVAEDAVEGRADLNDDGQVCLARDGTDDNTENDCGDQLGKQAEINLLLFRHDTLSLSLF